MASGSAPAKRYKGVVAIRNGSWQAQGPGRKYLGCHSREIDAARAVAKARGVSIAALVKRPPRTFTLKPARTHKWVYYHVGNDAWVVKRQKQWIGSYKKLSKAVAAAEKAFKKPASRFAAGGGLPTQGVAIDDLANIFRMQMKAFESGGGPPQLPGDVMHVHAKGLRGATSRPYEDSGMVLPTLLAKYGPDRECIAEACGMSQASPPDLAAHDYQRLIQALRSISRVPTDEMVCWMRGPGYKTTHHGGFPMWAWRSLKLIKRGRGADAFPLFQSRKLFVVKPLTKALRQRLERCRAFGEALVRSGESLQQTLAGWHCAASSLRKKVSKVPGSSSCHSHACLVSSFA
jgi:transposase